MPKRNTVSEFQLADELAALIIRTVGPRKFLKLEAADRRDLNDRCLELARHVAGLAAAPERPT